MICLSSLIALEYHLELITMQKLFTENAADGVPDHKDSSLIVRSNGKKLGVGDERQRVWG